MFTTKKIRIFLKEQAKESYITLKKRKDKKSQSILDSIERIKYVLKSNPQHGNPINKRLIPKQFIKLNIKNLYRIELPNYWRMIYTVQGNEIEVYVFILAIFNHKDYNKLFGFKK